MSTAQCSALANALASKGYDYAKLASSTGLSAQRAEEISTGRAKPTQQEFNLIASALGLSANPKHVAQVIA